MNKPIIGVTPLWDSEKDSVWMLPGYLQSIEAAGGIPIVLPLTVDQGNITQLLGLVDGLLFTGGQDVSPTLYGQPILQQCGELCPARDSQETILFQEGVLARHLPAFGICRGLQFFNSILGGTLYQDLPTQKISELIHEQKPPYEVPSHCVSMIPDSPLHQLLGETALMVNSCHHQAVLELADRLTAMAAAPDGLIEAAYMPEMPFVWGVQWHPEITPEHDASGKLFTAFVSACAAGKS